LLLSSAMQTFSDPHCNRIISLTVTALIFALIFQSINQSIVDLYSAYTIFALIMQF